MSAIERCPHCVVTPMRPYTNGFGGAFLTCLDCGYSDPISRKPDPFPDIVYRSKQGRTRRRSTKKAEYANPIPKAKRRAA